MAKKDNRISPEIEEEKTDEELVYLTLQNQANFLYLMKRYKAKLLPYIKRISGVDDDEAEDVLQNVFIKVYKNLNDFDPDLKFSSWIYRIAHNESISNYRKNKVRPHHHSVSLDDEIINKIIFDFNIEKEIDAVFLRKKIFDILDVLDEKYKEVIVLKFFEDKDYKEISDIIKKPMGTVASLMNRAKKEFGKEYQTRQQNLK